MHLISELQKKCQCYLAMVNFQMRLRISIRGRVRRSVRRSVGLSVPCYFRKTKIVDFEDGKSSNDVINNATMNDDEVVASFGPPRSLFSYLYLYCIYIGMNGRMDP